MDKKEFFGSIETLAPSQIVENELAKNRFLDIFYQKHTNKNDSKENRSEQAKIAYENEKFYFLKYIQEHNEIKACTKLSLYACFLDIAFKGITLADSTEPDCYIIPYSIKTGTDKWEKRANISLTGFHARNQRIRANQIKYTDPVEVIYKGEKCRIESSPDGIKIYHDIVLPRPSKEILLLYVRIVRPDGSVTFGRLSNDDIERLKGFSAKQNRTSGIPNALYKDLGFLKSKCLKHAFKSFPKIDLMNFSAITEGTESAEELGLSADQVESNDLKTESVKVPEMEKPIEEVKEELKEASQGVTVNDNDNIF